MLALAPKDLPEKMGPFCSSDELCPRHRSVGMLTLIVNVALSVEISVGFRWGAGILRSVLGWTEARVRAWTRFFVICPRTLRDRIAGDLMICDSILA